VANALPVRPLARSQIDPIFHKFRAANAETDNPSDDLEVMEV
jgi:hypothetical protein